MQQYQDGDRRFGYVRVNGQWMPEGAEGPAMPSIQTKPADPTQAYAAPMARLDVEAKTLANAKARKDLETGFEGGEDTDKRKAKIANLNALVDQVNRVQELYEQNIAGQPAERAFGATEYLPTQPNRQFDSAAAGLAEQGLAAFRVPGVGAQSDTELRQFVQANKPQASDYDTSIEEKLLQLRNRVDATRQEMGLPQAEWRQGSDKTSQYYAGPSGGDRMGLAQGDTQTVNNSAVAGLNARVNQLLRSGRDDREIIAALQGAGIDPNSDPKLATSLARAFEFRRKNPRYKGDYSVDLERETVPLTGAAKTMNDIGQSPLGAYGINAGDAVTLGTLDNMTGNPEQARIGVAGVRQLNPKASLAGTITGGALAAGGMEMGAAGLGLQGGKAALAGDLAFGAGYGAGSADGGNRLTGALGGGLAAVGGGLFGRTVASGGGRVLTGARDSATRYLTERGVPMTIGQIAGRGGRVGRTVKAVEDKLESIPLLGDAIKKRRQEGYEAFNQEAFKQALAPISQNAVGTVGEEGIESAQDAVSSAYKKALSGVNVQPDNIFVQQLTGAVRRGKALPGPMADEFAYAIQTKVAPELANGTLTGEAYQAIRQALRRERAEWKGKPRGHDYGQALNGVEMALEGLVRRKAPDVVPALNAADKAYGGVKTIQGAVSAGKNTSGIFTPAQLGTSAEASARKYGGKQGTTQRPFFELQRSAQDALPSQVPNSGTVDRAMAGAVLPAAIGGAGYGLGLDADQAALLGALGLPYTKAGQQILQRLMVERPDVVRKAGEALIKRKAVGGLFGAGAGVQALPAQ